MDEESTCTSLPPSSLVLLQVLPFCKFQEDQEGQSMHEWFFKPKIHALGETFYRHVDSVGPADIQRGLLDMQSQLDLTSFGIGSPSGIKPNFH